MNGFLRREMATWDWKGEYQRKLQGKQILNAFKLEEENFLTQNWFAFCEQHK
jgi:hypothetical protein